MLSKEEMKWGFGLLFVLLFDFKSFNLSSKSFYYFTLYPPLVLELVQSTVLELVQSGGRIETKFIKFLDHSKAGNFYLYGHMVQNFQLKKKITENIPGMIYHDVKYLV